MMTDRRRRPLSILALSLPVAPLLLTELATTAPVPSQATNATAPRSGADTLAAECALLRPQLTAFGLTEAASPDRVALLTEDEVHALARDPDVLRAAGSTSTKKVLAGIAGAVRVFCLVWFAMTRG